MEIETLPEAKVSTLPKWLLEMKQQLEVSKASHKKTEDQIAGLQGHVKMLTEHIGATLPPNRRLIVQNLPRSLSTPLSISRTAPSPFSARKQKKCLIVLLPNELLSNIMSFCDVKSIHRCEIASKLLRNYISISSFWLFYFKQYFMYLLRYMSPIQLSVSNCRQYLVRHFQQMNTCLRFLSDLKNEHFVSRHTLLTTHMYDAHYILSTILYLTCFSECHIHDVIIEHEGIRVIVKFLTHESGLLHQIACDIIANLLFAQHTRNTCLEDCSICRQLQFANARRALLSLLTSPTATVALSTAHHNAATHVSTTTASVQGVACQAASRALVNLFSLSNPIPLHCSACTALYAEDCLQLSGMPPPVCSNTDLSTLQNMPQQLSIQEFVPFELSYYHKSGSLQKTNVVWLKFYSETVTAVRAERMIGKGIDDNGHFILLGGLHVEITGYIWQMRLIYVSHDLDVVDWLFLDDELVYSNMRSQITFKAYWSDGRTVCPHIAHTNEIAEAFTGRGLWGVWEICSIGSHFELQKGGVFRAVPCDGITKDF